MIATPDIDRSASALAQLAGGRDVRNEYDATVTTTRRRAPRQILRSEDNELKPRDRKKLVATTRDVRRNFAIARWMIGKHLDYVTRFRFQPATGIPAVDEQLELLMRIRSRPQNCDVAGRHPLSRMIRLAEACRCVDGDMVFNKLSSGRLQAIEGDRIRTPNRNLPRDFDAAQWTHGVKTSKPSGRALEYAICNRKGTGFELAKTVPAKYIIHHAFWDRFDQVRGISPIASGLNELQDTREAFAFALARLKIGQLFGLVTKREASEAMGEVTAAGSDDATGTTTTTDETEESQQFEVEFGRGPFHLDIDREDGAEFLQDKNPSTEFDQFTSKIIMVALKSLDLPYSFYDESFTNFYGSRAALMQYLQSCETKRDDVRAVLDQITLWWVMLWIADGDLKLPVGMSLVDVKWEWIHAGIPWWDPSKDIRGDMMAVAAGWKTNDDVCKERTGRRFRDNIDQLAAEQDYIRQSGAMIVAPDSGVFNPEPVIAGDSNDA